MEQDRHISDAVKQFCEDTADELSYFKLSDMNVVPCRSCGSCSHKTPGECVFKDDIKVIFHELVKSNVVVMLTPIRFGGFSSHLKKVVDKFMLLGLPLYMVKKGHLLHPPRYDKKDLVVIGVKEKEVEGQVESFKTLAENIGLNLQYPYKTVILDKNDKVDDIKNKIKQAEKKEAI
jgi:multimeric flavodoxin WrbA